MKTNQKIKINWGDEITLPNRQSITPSMVTPEQALKWLDTSIGNRSTYSVSVAQMVQDMKDGKWNGMAKPVYLDENGKLMEGHHRLTAVVKSGETVPMLVVKGFPRADWDKLNRDRKWSVSAYAGARGISNAIVAMAGVKVRECLRRGLPLGSIACGGIVGGHIWNNQDFIDLYEADATWDKDVAFASSLGELWYGLPVSITVGVLHHLVHDMKYDRDFVTSFFNQLYTLEGITKSVRGLRMRLDKERNERIARNGKANQNVLCLLVASAFEGFVDNVPKAKLVITDPSAAPKFPRRKR